MSVELSARREMIVNALRLVALPTEKQVAALPDFVHVPDEIALIYDDAFRLVPELQAAEVLMPSQADALHELDRKFTAMTDAPDEETVWTLEAMQSDERWNDARRLACHALNLLGASADPPDFSGTHTWVRR